MRVCSVRIRIAGEGEAWLSRDDRLTKDEVLEQWFHQEYRDLQRLGYLMLGDEHAAEEVVMDAFAKALTRWSLFRSLDSAPLYLRRVVINACNSRMRRRAVEARVNELWQRSASSAARDENLPSRLDLVAAILSLPQAQRACIALRYLGDLSESQIAEVLDLPLGTVKSQLSRARKKMKKLLTEGGPSS